MSTRVPSSSSGSVASSQAQESRRARGTRAQEDDDGPKLIKKSPGELSPEAALWAGADMDRSLEIRAADVEGKLAELVAAEKADAEEGKDHASDVRDKNEHAEKQKGGLFKIFGFQKQQQATQQPKQVPKQPPGQQAQQQGAVKGLPAFKTPNQSTATSSARLQPVGGQPTPSATATSASRLNAVGGVQQKLMGAMAKAERPPDAFALLKEARDKGVLFVEDALADGHSEDKEDPEMTAAVEECIRLCFGVRGILRIGPGHNDKLEPIIVVATTHGFGEASFAKVPEKVHRFPTLIAIPFDLLPLKRER